VVLVQLNREVLARRVAEPCERVRHRDAIYASIERALAIRPALR
jgi:hypothetical protein